MLVVWPILIGSGHVPELHTQTAYMAFHLSSEAVTAVLCLCAGLGLLRRASWAPRLYFLSGSMSTTAIVLAIAFYAFASAPNKVLPLVGMLVNGVLTVGVLVAVHRASSPAALKQEARGSMLYAGATFYLVLNAAGFAAERRDGYSVSYACALFLLAFVSLWRTMRGGAPSLLNRLASVFGLHRHRASA